MFSKMLCALGFHDFTMWYYSKSGKYNMCSKVRYCRRCNHASAGSME